MTTSPTSGRLSRSGSGFRRLEWIEEAAPRVAPALERAGMTEELRTPLMACSPEEIVEPEVEGATVAPALPDDVRELVNIQRVAFGQAPLTDGEEPHPSSARARCWRGSGARPSRPHPGRPSSTATPRSSAVATAEPWRGRGLAGLVTAAATRAAFEAGASTCVLSPGDETALRVYARAGFRRVATMLHYSDPD